MQPGNLARMALALGWLGAAGAVAPIQDPKMTPGRIAVLANSIASEGAREQVKRAISDPDASVRAAAARVAGTLQLTDLATTIADTLVGEQDAVAASEQIRALLFLRGATAGPVIEAQMGRGGPTAALLVAEWLARVQPERLSDRLADLLRQTPNRSTRLGELVHMAGVQRPALSDRLSHNWLHAASASAWADYLELFQEGHSVGDAVIAEAVASQNADVRRYTTWSLVGTLGHKTVLSSSVVDAAVQNVEGPPADLWEAFGRELIARRYRNATTPDRAELITSEGRGHMNDIEVLPAVRELSRKERNAATVLLEAEGRKKTGNVASEAPPVPANTVGMHLASAPWPGFLRSVSDAAGCEPASIAIFGAARITYAPDGSPQKLVIDPGTLSSSCQSALMAIARLTVAEPDHPIVDGGTEWLVLPFELDSARCIDEPISEIRPVGVQREGIDTGRIAVPRKIRDVRPEYPEAAQKNGIQGTVVLKAIITTRGCVAAAHVLRSATPPLDFAAIRAVTGWRFEPTRLDDRPVAVYMTVTVNFTLQ